MEILKDFVLILHFLGLAAIIGGVLAQMRQTPKRVDALVVYGALTQMVTGVALVVSGWTRRWTTPSTTPRWASSWRSW